MNNKITVSLVEDNPVFRDALMSVLSKTEGVEVAHLATDLREGRAFLRQRPTDVLLVDLDLPDGSGHTLITEALQAWPQCRVMVISVFSEESKVFEAMQAGARGYLLKGGGMQQLQEQIQQFIEGGSPMTPSIGALMVNWFKFYSNPDDQLDVSGLSPQEAETMRYVAKGFTYAEIARLMSISVTTVKAYVNRVYDKLQVSSKTEALHELRRLHPVDKPRRPPAP
jgi:DNA-binding NarL/FixJ family response regulator